MVEVTQEDRDAAAELGDAVFCHPDIVALAFARHGQAGVQQGLDMAERVAEAELVPIYDDTPNEIDATCNTVVRRIRDAIRKLGGDDETD